MIAPRSEAGPHTPEGIAALVADHPLLAGLPGDMARLVTGCARNVAVKSGELLLVEGEAADTLFLLRRGRVSLEARAPGRTPLVIETLEPGAGVGWSWLFPPYRWQFDARAAEPVGAIAVEVTDPPPVGLFAGYHKDDDANAKAFRDGWYYTGDTAWRDGDGYLWFEGRDDDVITSSAYRIGPFEVESALIEHPAVMEAAVVGKDDPQRTQIVTAFVTLAGGQTPSDELAAELQAHTRKLTAPYKYPREIHFVSELPKTVSGKIRRSQLREWLRGEIPS